MPSNFRQRIHRWNPHYVLLAATVCLTIVAALSIWLSHHRQQRAIEDLLKAVKPRPGMDIVVIRQPYDDPPHYAAIIVVPGGPEWLRRAVGDRPMVAFDRVERIGCAGISNADAAAKHIRRLPHLRSLLLIGSDLTDSGLATVAACRRLEELDLTYTNITDAGLHHLQHIPQLKRLDLDGTNITDSGLEQIAKLPELRSLRLVIGRRITNSGLVHIGRLRRLEFLHLDEATIPDDGLQHLKGLSELQELWISSSPITDAGLVHLSHLPKLKRVMLRRTDVTQDGIDKLKLALPTLEVHYDGGL